MAWGIGGNAPHDVVMWIPFWYSNGMSENVDLMRLREWLECNAQRGIQAHRRIRMVAVFCAVLTGLVALLAVVLGPSLVFLIANCFFAGMAISARLSLLILDWYS